MNDEPSSTVPIWGMLICLIAASIFLILDKNAQDSRLAALQGQVDSLQIIFNNHDELTWVIPADQILPQLDSLEVRVRLLELRPDSVRGTIYCRQIIIEDSGMIGIISARGE